MAEPTNAGTLPGLPEDAHPTHTFEAVTTEADFHAGLAQPTKNARLLSALTSYAVDRSWLDHAEAHLMLVALLAEPDLSARDLLAMTRVWFGGLSGLIAAICAHPHANDDVLIAALWDAGQDAHVAVAAHTGTQLVAVIAWVHARMLMGGFANTTARARIATTNDAWATWCGTDPGRARFLLTSSFDFDNEETMFAAGAAITAPAGHHGATGR